MRRALTKTLEEPWHAMSVDQVLRKLGASCEGLDPEEASARLERYGPNALPEPHRLSPALAFLKQFQSPLIYILLIAGTISFALGQNTDGIVILAIVFFNAVIGFVQEYKAERALEELKKLAAPTAIVLRDGREQEIPTQQIVPGDLILVSAGDHVPADARITQAIHLRVDEAPLTGESVPVDKRDDVLPADTVLAERDNMLYSGTPVVAGRGRAVVVATGYATVTGRIAEEVEATPKAQTHMQRKLADIGRLLGVIAVFVALVLAGIGLARGYGLEMLFLLAVAVAVSFIPEGLPAIVAIVLAVGVQRMARRKAIVRKLPAVESLGSVAVICTDKTGTLTRNEMTVQVCCTARAFFRFSGEGYAPTGRVCINDQPINPDDYPELRLLLTVGALCNDSSLVERDGQWSVRGDPTEGALVVAAAKAGIVKSELDEEYPRIDEIPFDPETRYMATLNRPKEGPSMVCVKGAPEEILALCGEIRGHDRKAPLSDERRSALHETTASMAGQAYRVLATACIEVDREKSSISEQNFRGKLTFLGFFGMIDPPRPEAIQAVAKAKQAGIRVIMVTGDNPVTAETIARTVGVLDGGEVVTGHEVERMSDEELARRILRISVFARVEPQDKYRIVKALKQNGELVAMTGDGVNDAPALKLADVGVAMGITGTNVAKESSDMVLADDNFATIVAAVEEGRTIFANIRKIVQYLLATNTGEVLTYVIAITAGLPPPLLPVQILWVNLVTDGFATAPLAVEPKEGDILREPPRNPREPVLTSRAIARIAVTAAVMAAVTLGLFIYQLGYADLGKARTMAFEALALLQLFNAFNARSPVRSVFKLGFLSNPYMLLGISASFVLQVLVTQLPLLQPAFHTVGLSLAEWALVIGLSSLIFVFEEIRKALIPNLFYDPPRTIAVPPLSASEALSG